VKEPGERAMNPYLEVLDRRAFDQFVALWGEDAGEIIREIVTMYLDAGPHTLEEIRLALDAEDLPEARRLAHSFKANSATVGAHRLALLCQRLEDAAKEGRKDEAYALLQDVEREFELVQKALQNVLSVFGV